MPLSAEYMEGPLVNLISIPKPTRDLLYALSVEIVSVGCIVIICNFLRPLACLLMYLSVSFYERASKSYVQRTLHRFMELISIHVCYILPDILR